MMSSSGLQVGSFNLRHISPRLDDTDGPAVPALILAVFIVALWKLSQHNYALFDALFFQPVLQHDQLVYYSLPTRNKRPCGRLNSNISMIKMKIFFELLDNASLSTWNAVGPISCLRFLRPQ